MTKYGASTILASMAILAMLTLMPTRANDGGSNALSGSAGGALAKLAWMTGDWRSDHKGDVLQEVWSEPIGDSMMGAFRWIKGEKTWMYELITITDEGDTVVLRFKHFNNKMFGWEEKDECLDFTLVRTGKREVVFEHPTRRNAKRLIYRSLSDNTLIVRVEGIEKDGSTSKEEYTFKRHTP